MCTGVRCATKIGEGRGRTNAIASIFLKGSFVPTYDMRNRKIPFTGELASIAGFLSSISNEEIFQFLAQKSGKFKRFGYISCPGRREEARSVLCRVFIDTEDPSRIVNAPGRPGPRKGLSRMTCRSTRIYRILLVILSGSEDSERKFGSFPMFF